VKDLDHTKTRLSSVLDLEARQALTLRVLDQTLRVLRSCRAITDILVLTPDDRVLSFATRRNVRTLREEGRGLNEAMEQATLWAMDGRYDALLILPADLPSLMEQDVEAMITLGRNEERIVVIAPNEGRNGTNGLFIRPPGILRYCFGPESFLRHQGQASTQHFELKVYASPSIGFDLDDPEQVERQRKEAKIRREDDVRSVDSNPWHPIHRAGR
jgi:2-phospho-L-lactate guanylyltransferase